MQGGAMQVARPMQELAGEAKAAMIDQAAEAAKMAGTAQWTELEFQFTQECCIACLAPCIQAQKNIKEMNMGDGQQELGINGVTCGKFAFSSSTTQSMKIICSVLLV